VGIKLQKKLEWMDGRVDEWKTIITLATIQSSNQTSNPEWMGG
jgi:hypothetical protein